MSEQINKDFAIKLLRQKNTSPKVIEHCSLVSFLACEFANKLSSNGCDVDIEFVVSAALLHDIGRSVTHGIEHGVEGAKILSDYPDYARVCETHIGGGITKEEAVKLGLPEQDFLPKTVEEKIICIADKLTDGTKRITLDETIKKYEQRLGKNHPTIERIKKLYAEIVE